jgi:hypothetical protein
LLNFAEALGVFDFLVELGQRQKVDGVVQHIENAFVSEFADLRAELVSVD